MPFLNMPAGSDLDIEGNAAVTMAVSGSAAHSPVLEEGSYDVWCSVDVYLKVASTANNVTTATGYLLRTGGTVTMRIRSGSRIGAIAGGAGTLSYHKVS